MASGIWAIRPFDRVGAGGVLLAGSVDGVLFAASVGRALSPSAYVVVLLKSDFLGFYY